MPTFEEIRARFQQQSSGNKPSGEEFYGAVDVFEGTVINLRASLKGVKSGVDDAEWIFDDKSKARTNVPIKLSAKTVETVTLNPVPDDKGSYKFTYKLKIGDDERKGLADFTVWPKKLHVTAKYKNKTGETHATLKDNDPVNNFGFKVVQTNGEGAALVSSPYSTDDKGVCTVQATYPGDATMRGISPWEVVEPADHAGQPRKREVKVSQKPWKAKIHSPAGGKTADAPVKQFVNQPKDYAANKGKLVQVEVGPTDPSLGKKDQEIKVRVTFDKANSKRNVPVPGLWVGETEDTAHTLKVTTAKPGEDELVYEKTFKLPADGQKCRFYICMGPAGGDKCKVEVGVTDTIEDDVLYIQNWRLLAMEVLTPEDGEMQACTDLLNTSGAKPELADALKTQLKTIMDPVFVDFYYPDTMRKYFTESDLDGAGHPAIKGQHMWVDGAYVDRTPALTGKVFVPRSDMLTAVREKLAGSEGKPKDRLRVQWCDFLSSKETKNNYLSDVNANHLTLNFEAPGSWNYTLGFHVFEIDPYNASGMRGVKGIRWRLWAYKLDGDADWTDMPETGGTKPAWMDDSFWDKRAYQSAPVNTKAKIERYFKPTKSRKGQLFVPDSEAGDPGNFLQDAVTVGTTNTNVSFKGRLQILMVGVHFNVLGSAFAGQISMTTQGGTSTTAGCAMTIAHEAGHNLGHTYIKNLGAGELHSTPVGTDNRGRATTFEIPNVPFGKVVPDGPYFAGKGFAGAHCASAIKKKVDGAGLKLDKDVVGKTPKPLTKEDVYKQPDWGSPSTETKTYFTVGEDEHCIMYATTDPGQVKPRKFCDDCKTYILATEADDITRDWRT